MKNIEQLKEEFVSTPTLTKIIQKWQFTALTEDEFRLLISTPGLRIHCTPMAQKYIVARKNGTLIKVVNDDEPKERSPEDIFKSIDSTIISPRGF